MADGDRREADDLGGDAGVRAVLEQFFQDLGPGPEVERELEYLRRQEGEHELFWQGGMAAAWVREDPLLERNEVVKYVRLFGDDERTNAEALREARLIARIDHPGVVRVHSVEEVGETGRLQLVLGHVDAQTLTELCEAGGPLSPAEAAALGLKLCDALAHVHDAGIVHGDLKPDNVLYDLTREQPVLIDFGVGMRPRGAGDDSAIRGATPGFSAPEQLQGGPVDHRADLFALGATLQYLLTGEPPFDVPADSPLDPSTWRRRPLPERGIPEKLRWIVATLLEFDPGRRFSAAVCRDQLRFYLVGEESRMPFRCTAERIVRGTPEPLENGTPVRDGDVLQFRAEGEGRAFVYLVGLDDAGNCRLHHPDPRELFTGPEINFSPSCPEVLPLFRGEKVLAIRLHRRQARVQSFVAVAARHRLPELEDWLAGELGLDPASSGEEPEKESETIELDAPPRRVVGKLEQLETLLWRARCRQAAVAVLPTWRFPFADG